MGFKKKKKAAFSFGSSLCFASSEFDDNMLQLISVARDWFYLRVVTVNLLHFLSFFLSSVTVPDTRASLSVFAPVYHSLKRKH